MIKTPAFWYKNKGVLSTLLLPAAWLYQLGNTIAQAMPCKIYKASIPVLCVGNAIAGGGGKTPTVIALISFLKENGLYKNPYILTRGYGSKNDVPLLVDVAHHAASDVGDEPLLLAQHAPTIVSANRSNGAKMAQAQGADVIIMDDGLLHRSLHKDLTVLVVDRQIDFGNNRTLPAGPLRQPLSKTLPQIDCVFTIGRPFDAADYPVFETTLTTTKKPDPNTDYIAFAGIAIPDKFKNTLLDLGYTIKEWHEFADHHPYSQSDIDSLKQTAAKHQARQLITTEKDFVRLPPDFQKEVETLPVTITLNDQNALITFIKNHLKTS